MLFNATDLDLIVRFFNEPNNADLKQSVDNFKSLSKAHNDFYLEIEKIWIQAPYSSRLEALDRIKSVKTFKTALKQSAHKPNTIFRWVAGIAAALLLIGIGFILNKQSSVDYVVKKTSAKEIDSIKLADGTEVMLSSGTAIKYPKKFNSDIRRVYLIEGQAFFNVAKDKNHPFKIELGQSEVTVVGTSFNINFRKNIIQLDVKTGVVKFSPNSVSDNILLNPGQGIVYNLNRNLLETRQTQNLDSWFTNNLVFVDTPLEEVCRQLSRNYNVEIELQGYNQTKKFNAKFNNTSLTDILEVLKTTYGAKVQTDKEKITLKIPHTN